MKPGGLLMIEHRLIEKMIQIIEKEIGEIKKKRAVDPVFVDTAVDFIKTYADRTHHGKEEDRIFFPETERYFTESELGDLLNAFREFDMKMIHEKYSNVVAQLRGKYSPGPY
jgi:hemerythrin-like domain-containing protein